MMVELSVIRDFVAIFGVIAGFSYYVLTVRATRRNQDLQLETRQAQLFMQIYDRVWSKETQDALNILWSFPYSNEEFEKRFTEDFAFQRAFTHWAYIYERVGLLLKAGLFKVELVFDSSTTINSIIDEWEKYRDSIYKFRETGVIGKNSYNMCARKPHIGYNR
jgi:hypothetical protein